MFAESISINWDTYLQMKMAQRMTAGAANITFAFAQNPGLGQPVMQQGKNTGHDIRPGQRIMACSLYNVISSFQVPAMFLWMPFIDESHG